MSWLLKRFVELMGRHPVLASGSVVAGLTAGVFLGFRIVAPFIFS